jgi:hypothetical protein
MKYNHLMQRAEKLFLLSILLILLCGTCAEVWDIAWGTGNAIGKMSLVWAILSFAFFILCLFFFLATSRVLWRDDLAARTAKRLVAFRRRLGWGRWFLAAVVFFFPAIFLQFTIFGIILQGFFLRVGLWVFALVFVSFLLADEDTLFSNWERFLVLALLSSALFAVFASLKFVTDYPFSLGWSEGNRVWDYSILFGSGRYEYPSGQIIPVFLDSGRQFIGGIPFLLPGLTIGQERLWLGLVSIIPYLLLGLAAFHFFSGQRIFWLSAVLWAWLFLRQGPINATLILCAVLVVLAWKANLWVSAAYVLLATYAAYLSRYTWIFAPAIWFLTLELFDGFKDFGKTPLSQRTRLLLAALALCGITGLVILGGAAGAYFQLDWAYRLPPAFSTLTSAFGRASQQSLLWYRLLPNETYGSGILIGTTIAVLPLMAMLARHARINRWQKWIVALPLLAFFAVGLVVSAKIGGGGDLHNMDMFLIGLFLAAALILDHQGIGWIQATRFSPLWARAALVLAITIPGVNPLRELRSYEFATQASRLAALTDSPNERALEMYPSDTVVEKRLATIQAEANLAKQSGSILFMDQRQLLTFGYIQNIPLIPQYDKKVLMDQALASDEIYFQTFYADLAAKRFSLIITHPLIVKSQGSDEFGEENNAWVKWVTKPLLCFYKVKQTLSDVNAQLLVPKQGEINCEKDMP